ncbi:MAG: hypothetical protein FJ290_01260 [Planctomycetes bacterium]|nr:hypothetical protein [Planctomycetota bacterium]
MAAELPSEATGGAGTAAPVRPWRRAAGLVLGLGLVGALVAVVASQWRRLPTAALAPNWWFVLLSFAVLRVHVWVGMLRWRAVVRALGGALPVPRAYAVFTLGALGRYVPGKAALVAARAYLSVREGLSLRVAMVSIFYEQVLHVLGAAIITALWIGLSGPGQPLPVPARWAAVAVAAAGVLAVHPWLVSRAMALAGRLLRRSVVVEGLSYRQMLPLELGFLLYWLLAGLALYLFVRAFHPLPFVRVLDCTAIGALSMVLGLITLIAPAGIGILEGTAAALLSAYMPLPLAAAIALALRVLITLGEACDVALALLLRRQKGT